MTSPDLALTSPGDVVARTAGSVTATGKRWTRATTLNHWSKLGRALAAEGSISGNPVRATSRRDGRR